MKTENRLLELDALRGIAALSVMLYHYTSHYFEIFKLNSHSIVNIKYGYLGVQLFFIISGFVIFMTLNKIKKPYDFLVSRFSRIYPAYWFCLIITFSTLYFFNIPNRVTSFKVAFVNLSMLQMFFKIPNVDGVYWSLRVELLFYFWMLILYIRKSLNKIEWIGLIWMALMIFSFYVEFPKYIRILKILLLLNFGHLFLAGIIFYKIKNEGFTKFRGLILLITFLVQYIIGDYETTFAVAIFYIIFIIFTINKLHIINKFKPLLFLGAISYPLYLIHQNIGYVFIRALNKKFNIEVSILMTITVVLITSSLIHFFIEKPSNKYIKNYFYQFTNRSKSEQSN